MRHARDVRVRHAGDLDLRPLDDAAVILAGCEEVVDPRRDMPDNFRRQERTMTSNTETSTAAAPTTNSDCMEKWPPRPAETASNDPEVLRAALAVAAEAAGGMQREDAG